MSLYCSWVQVLVGIVQELPLAYFLFSFNSVSPGVMGIELCFTTPTLTLSQLVMKSKTKILTTARTLALLILNQNAEWEPSFLVSQFQKLCVSSAMKLSGVVAPVCTCGGVL